MLRSTKLFIRFVLYMKENCLKILPIISFCLLKLEILTFILENPNCVYSGPKKTLFIMNSLNLTKNSIQSLMKQLHCHNEGIMWKSPDRWDHILLQYKKAESHYQYYQNCYSRLKWEVLFHPLYSPYLILSDFYACQSLSNASCRISFKNDVELWACSDEFSKSKLADFD